MELFENLLTSIPNLLLLLFIGILLFMVLYGFFGGKKYS